MINLTDILPLIRLKIKLKCLLLSSGVHHKILRSIVVGSYPKLVVLMFYNYKTKNNILTCIKAISLK